MGRNVIFCKYESSRDAHSNVSDVLDGEELNQVSELESDFFDKVDEIAKLKTELTKAHLECIEHVKAILTDEQYEELLDYGVVNMF